MKIPNDNQRFKLFSNELSDILIIRNKVILLIHKFFDNKNFILADPPILHERIWGKKHEIYLPLYENRYSLNSSNALYMAAYASIFKKAYAISPCFRDEHDSINHLIEFRMLEVEIVNMTYNELPDFVEGFIRSILLELSKLPEIQNSSILHQRIESLITSFHPQRISYKDFVQKINCAEREMINRNVDLSEIDYMISGYISNPVFIMDYPKNLASWTAKWVEKESACAFNLMLPETFGELCEGCERTNDIELLQTKINVLVLIIYNGTLMQLSKYMSQDAVLESGLTG